MQPNTMYKESGPVIETPLSAVREGGATRWVRLTSEAGAPCVVRHGIAGAVDVRDGRGRPLRHSDTGEGALRIPCGRATRR